MQWTERQPQSGDIIRTKVRFYHHYGIYVTDDRVIQFGLPDNTGVPNEQICVLATDIYTFLNGGSLEVATPDREERKTMRPAKEVVALAESRLGQTGYDILHNNCEHFVNDCVFGTPTSGWLEEARAKLRAKLGKE